VNSNTFTAVLDGELQQSVATGSLDFTVPCSVILFLHWLRSLALLFSPVHIMFNLRGWLPDKLCLRAPCCSWLSTQSPCGLWVERIDPFRFLAGCHKRRPDQTVCPAVNLGFFSVCLVLFSKATHIDYVTFLVCACRALAAFTIAWVRSQAHPFWAVVSKSNAG